MLNNKIFLGPLLAEDAAPMFEWANDVSLAHLNGPYRPISWVDHANAFSQVGKDPSKVVFSIRRTSDRRLVGYLQIVNIHPAFRSADIGILIGDERERGKGYGTEAMRRALAFCWNELNLIRVALLVFGDNPHAVALYRKVGFEHEGTLRQAAYVNGRHVDITLMAALRPEFVPPR
ncbi:MAG: GNAT family protein [Magnetospirillum sp.]|nr:GNAT family protein [Magnetospirillum sp.]